jgi:hypothetical protein
MATSTITGRTKEEEDARAFGAAPKVWAGLQGLGRLLLDLAPGSGEVMSGQESVEYGDQGYEALRRGEMLGALSSFGQSALSALGAIPGAGTIGRLAKKTDDVARLARAKAMGFYTDIPLYHGTAGDIKAFDLARGGQMSGSPVGALGVSAALDLDTAQEFAELAAQSAGQAGKNQTPTVLELYHRAQKPAQIDLTGKETNLEIAATVQNAWERGYDAILFNNYTTPGGHAGRKFILVKDPNQLRKQLADFDPAKRDSSDLLATLVPLAGLGYMAIED